MLQYLNSLGCDDEIKSLANMINTDTELVKSSLDGLHKMATSEYVSVDSKA